MKIKLDKLKVTSFKTDLDILQKGKVKGGKPDFFTEVTCWHGCPTNPLGC